jgi:hypothetical protein
MIFNTILMVRIFSNESILGAKNKTQNNDENSCLVKMIKIHDIFNKHCV